MAEFRYKSIRHMTPRSGMKYATDYYKQSKTEYSRLDEHVRQVMEQVVRRFDAEGLIEELEQPLAGFPRTQKQPNYTALDVMTDMLRQLNSEKDVPSGILGRWNRLFEANEDFRIDMQEDRVPEPVYNRLFVE